MATEHGVGRFSDLPSARGDAPAVVVKDVENAMTFREHVLALLFWFECDFDYVVEEIRKTVGPKEANWMTTMAQRLMQRGEVKGKADTLLRQLTKRFGAVAEPTKSRLCAATVEQLDRGAEAVLDARRLEDVLDAVDGGRPVLT